MSLDPNVVKFVEDVFASLGNIRVRKMFSGGGIYCDGIIFGLISRNIIFLKVDPSSTSDYQAEGSSPFFYKARTKIITLPYWRLPDRLLDETDEILDWAKRSLAFARSQSLIRKAKRKKSAK